MRWKGIFMIVLVFLKTYTLIQDFYLEVGRFRWRFRQELTNKQVNIKALNSFPLEQVIYILIIVGYAL
jgi:hypothetical protein